jgi:hypothetical protein
MPGAKVTMFFVQDKYSWTEDHYYVSASGINLNSLVLPATSLAAVRSQLLGFDAALERIRLSQFPANQQVQDVLFPAALTGNWAVTAGNLALWSAARAYNALLTRLSSSGGYHRNYYLAGCPEGIFHSRLGDDTGLDFSVIPEFLTRFYALVTQLTTGSWGWLTRTQSVLVQAGGLVTNAAFPGMLGIQVPAALPGVVQGTPLQVSGWRRVSIKASPPLTGVYKCGGVLAPVAPSTMWTYFLFNTSLIPPTNFFTLGKIGVYTPAFATYNQAQPAEATSRKRGATALRPRGRSRTQF